ncbi:hypothetical protein B0H13DRAFT_1895636 [Mycena leptocephala]|nr:hypothetical protein B0H13DRAFT_1895636 [Mycena leptocephala]
MDVPDSPTVSQKFNFADANVTFKSSDGVLFHVHRKNLEVCTEGFPPAEISTTAGEIVDLPETAETLELLFQFMYPQRHPALDTTPSRSSIRSPRPPRSTRDMVHEHPVEVAVYAAKHDYPYLVSQVAPMMLSMPPVDVVGLLPGYLVLPWIRYVQEWTRVHQTVALKFQNEQRGAGHHFNGQYCNNPSSWLGYSFACIQHLAPGVHTLRSLDNVFDYDIPVYDDRYGGQSYECCRGDLQAWRKRIEDAIAEIPKFHTFL